MTTVAFRSNTTTYAYDPASNLATATYPNGVQVELTYDALNRLTIAGDAGLRLLLSTRSDRQPHQARSSTAAPSTGATTASTG
jgi:YD repeat-containing protein